jgi:hypothetical protein
MAFNANNFVNSSNVPPLYRLVNQITSTSVSGLPQSATTIAQQTAQTIASTGASLTSIQQQTASMLDGLLSYGSPDFFAGSGLAPAKASAADISSMRVNGGSSKTYFTTSNPNIKVDQKIKSNQAVVISVL